PKRLVYLDNAATTPVRPEVLEAMLPYLGPDAFGNPSSPHRFGRAARAGVEEAKRSIAAALGADPGQVIFTSGGTEADNLAVIGCALAARERGGPFRVAVSAIELKAFLAAAHPVVRLGGEEIILPVNGQGEGAEGGPGGHGVRGGGSGARGDRGGLGARARGVRRPGGGVAGRGGAGAGGGRAR